MSNLASSKAWTVAICFAPVIIIAIALVAKHPVQQGSAAVKASRAVPSGKVLAAQQKMQASYASLPLAFEQNQGQTDARVKYVARGEGYTVFLTGTDTVFSLHSRSAASKSPGGRLSAAKQKTDGRVLNAEKTAVIHMQLARGNSPAKISATGEMAAKSNYFIGNDQRRWRTDVPRYARVSYQNVYPGVDVAFHGAQRQLEFDFVVAAGADAAPIAFQLTGNQGVKTDTGGNLVIATKAGDVVLHKPVAYQEVNGLQQRVESKFTLKAKNEVGFEIGNYDHGRELVIDPSVSVNYATYLGGSLEDDGYAITFDSGGNAYVTGKTDSTAFPGASGFAGGFDVFVSKIAASGASLVYSTYIGGTSDDSGNAIAIDSNTMTSKYVYVAGGTSSTDFPVLPSVGAYQTTLTGAQAAFIAKLDSTSGGMLYATYLGGTGSDAALGVAVDGSGNIYAAGTAGSTNFPTKNALQTNAAGGFLAKLTPAGAGTSDLIFSTYIGGGASDFATGVALDASGNAFVTGQTAGSLPVTTGAYQGTFGGGLSDAFVSAVKTDGSAYLYSTYLGGAGDDAADGIAVDASGNAYITGETDGSFPLQSASQGTIGGMFDAFVAKLNPSGSALVYSTYLGGSLPDNGAAIAVDGSGNAYVTGETLSTTNFPLKSSTQSAFGGGTSDAFVSEFNGTGSLVFSTYLGGAGDEDIGGKFGGIAVDQLGATIYVTGSTSAAGFPATTGSLQTTFANGAADAFVAKYTQQTFELSATAPAAVSAGASATSTVTLTAANGYNSQVNLSCSVSGTGSPAPACSASSFSPASPITPTASGAQTTLTITTTAAHAQAFFASKTFYAVWLPILGISFIGISANSTRSRRRKLLGFAMISVALAALLVMPACGGGGSSSGGGGGKTGGTPSGSYTVTITATGTDAATTTQATQVVVTVN